MLFYTTEPSCVLFGDCCFDITLNKHSIMITNTGDDLSLDNKTVVVSYKQVYDVFPPRWIGYKLDSAMIVKTICKFSG